MASCKDCIHYCRCKDTVADENWVDVVHDIFTPEGCADFKPSADVVEVVRCKDCKYRGDYGCPMYYEEDIEWDDDGYTECDTIIHDRTADNDFCSYGERKETNDI